MELSEFTAGYSELFPFYNKLSVDQKERLSRGAMVGNYEKGINLHGNTGECTGLMVVLRGCLRAYMLSETGKEITLYRLYPKDVCILSASCVLEAITFEVYIDAEVDSQVLLIRPNVFQALYEENVWVENFALSTTTKRFSDVMWAMEQILFMSFDKRLAVFLLTETKKTGGARVNLSMEQMAKYMGSAREVVSRMVKYFAGEGMVRHGRGYIEILDVERLAQIAGMDK